MVNGIFAYPFNNKWVGLDAWFRGLGQVLSWLAIGGLIGWLWRRDGRLLLCMFLGSLVPFSATWTVRGGAEWRLTLFVYSFYLVAAFWCVRAAHSTRSTADFTGWLRGTRFGRPSPSWCSSSRPMCWIFFMPYAVARESLARGHAAMIRADERDRFLLTDGWSDLVVTGNVTRQVQHEPAASIRLPLPESRPYTLLLRIDPLHYPEAPPQRVHVSLNGQSVCGSGSRVEPRARRRISARPPCSRGTPRIERAHVALGADGADRKSRHGIS